MICIKCKDREASATPTLCLRCFKQTALEWWKFHHTWDRFDLERSEARFKNFMNKTQRRIRKAHKRHDTGL